MSSAALSALAMLVYAAPMWPYKAPTWMKGDALSATDPAKGFNAQFKQVEENLNDLNTRADDLEKQLAMLSVGTAQLADGAATSAKVKLTGDQVRGSQDLTLDKTPKLVPGTAIKINATTPQMGVSQCDVHLSDAHR